ncbi:unnamed protein product [Vitrella brassicaformis CCMP3155]|uniref:Ubiquitin-like protease family profile domain-containing protein n=2 Tax=Vitrella brassicaformis TaxID=1169539 RepID=A0A0G4EBQ5_VITBC|nr:unnamed protein product [Vitrella brassicaformis CCMP3155]|eukprot:CEL93408.1 unnamed protein product [Vitrella brassicaformis CCMP3155]
MDISGDPVLPRVTLHNARLYDQDIRLLQEGNLLNDSCIGFALEYLSTIGDFKDQSDVLFMDPATSFWVNIEDDLDDLKEGLEALSLSSRRLLLVPLNDNEDRQVANAGSHWSLLVIHNPSDGPMSFDYYDSMGSGILPVATKIARKLSSLLRPQDDPNSAKATVTVQKAAQQTNATDCGVYVLLFAEHIARKHLGQQATQPADITPKHVSSKRKELQLRVQEMAAATSEERDRKKD